MKYDRTYYKDIDIIRIIACIAILLYHLNIVKGGYLAVCSFFVLSGYLACARAFKKKDDFSIKQYYIKQIKRVYIPLIIVVMVTVGVISLIPTINWFNLKPETTSVILGYNNFWQINANLDYFARHIDSPFMHLWYIAIMLQFDLVFPFIFLLLKKIGNKVKKWVPCLLLGLLSILGFVYFGKTSSNIMSSYYGTLTRSFALIYGMFIGFFHHYYYPKIANIFMKKPGYYFIFGSYCLILVGLFIFAGTSASWMIWGMGMTTLISGRLIDYALVNHKLKTNKLEKGVKSLSKVSYEIYLWQYPLIFISQYCQINSYLKIFMLIGSTIILAYMLHYVLDWQKRSWGRVIVKVILLIPLSLLGLYGSYRYVIAKDHTQEMKDLEQQLEINQQKMLDSQKKFREQHQKEDADWLAKLQDLENGEKEIADIVKNLPIVGVGDSVMLGALEKLSEQFPNSYFDAAISRTAWVAGGILQDLKDENLLGNVVILNLGANGDCSNECKDKIMDIIGERKVYWVNIKNNENLHFNEKIAEYAKNYPNLEVIDWYSISENHPEYFVADGIHLTEAGREAYTQAIYDSIYNTYLTEYKKQVQDIIDNHEIEEKNKISFYGNELLVNAYETLKDSFADASFVAEKEINYADLYQKIKQEINDKSLMYNVVLLLDSNFMMNKEEYAELVSLCQDRILYIVTLNDEVESIISDGQYSNVKLIDFNEQLKRHEDYLMADKVHLSTKGNEKLKEILLDNFK